MSRTNWARRSTSNEQWSLSLDDVGLTWGIQYNGLQLLWKQSDLDTILQEALNGVEFGFLEITSIEDVLMQGKIAGVRNPTGDRYEYYFGWNNEHNSQNSRSTLFDNDDTGSSLMRIVS